MLALIKYRHQNFKNWGADLKCETSVELDVGTVREKRLMGTI